jgi:hypothetical protein
MMSFLLIYSLMTHSLSRYLSTLSISSYLITQASFYFFYFPLFLAFSSIPLHLFSADHIFPFPSIPFHFFHAAHSGHHKGGMEHSSCSHSCLGCTEWCYHSMGFTSEKSMVRHSCCHVLLGFQLLVTEAVLKLNVTSSPHKMSLFTLFDAFDLMMMPTSLYVCTYSPTLCTRGMQVRA